MSKIVVVEGHHHHFFGRCVVVCVVGCCARLPAACASADEHTTNVTIHFESWIRHLHLILYEALHYD
jgi:hypothetical protein